MQALDWLVVNTSEEIKVQSFPCNHLFRGGSKGVLHYSIMCSYAIISVEEIKCDLCMQKRRTRRLGNPVDCLFVYLHFDKTVAYWTARTIVFIYL